MPYVTQTDLDTTITNTIKDLLENLDDKYSKQDARFKKTIAEQDAKFDAKSDLVTLDQRIFYSVFIKPR